MFLPTVPWPWVWLSPWWKWLPGTSPGVKAAVLEADYLTTFMCRMSWKSGNLNLLEPSGPHRAGYGTTLLHISKERSAFVSRKKQATLRNVPEDFNLFQHHYENLKTLMVKSDRYLPASYCPSSWCRTKGNVKALL